MPKDYVEHYQSRGVQTMEQVEGLNRMIAKKEKAGGIVTGYHGTSEKRALEIQEKGFENYRSVDGTWGVHFHDDEHPDNARLAGRTKAEKEGQKRFAIIRATLKNPSPDFLGGRPQWLATVDQITIEDIEFFDVSDKGK